MANAIEQYKGWMEKFKPELEKLLGDKRMAERMATLVLGEFRREPHLMECQPASIFNCVRAAAQLRLDFGHALGQAYILPFRDNERGVVEATFCLGYRGMVTLAHRSDYITAIHAELVYKGERFELQSGTEPKIDHRPKIDRPPISSPADARAHITCAYAVAWMKAGGPPKITVMSLPQIEAIRARAKTQKVWKKDWGEMAKKTVVRRLFKTLPVDILPPEAHQYLAQEDEVLYADYSVLDEESGGAKPGRRKIGGGGDAESSSSRGAAPKPPADVDDAQAEEKAEDEYVIIRGKQYTRDEAESMLADWRAIVEGADKRSKAYKEASAWVADIKEALS